MKLPNKILYQLSGLTLVLFLFIFSACRSTSAELGVGLLVNNGASPQITQSVENFKQAMTAKKMPYKVADAKGQAALQLVEFNEMLHVGVRNFILMPVTKEASTTIAAIGLDQKLSIVFIGYAPDDALLEANPNFFVVSSDENAKGVIQANIVDDYFTRYPDLVPDNGVVNLVFFAGDKNDDAVQRYRQAFQNTFSAKGRKSKITAENFGATDRVSVKKAMDDIFSAHRGEFDFVVTQTDAMALGVLDTFKDKDYLFDDLTRGARTRVPVVGADGTDDAFAALDDGLLYATIFYDASEQIKIASELIANVAQESYKAGDAINDVRPQGKVGDDTQKAVGQNGGAQFYYVPFKAILHDNYKNFLKRAPQN